MGRQEQRESPLPAAFQAESRQLEAIFRQGSHPIDIGNLAPHFVAQRLLLDRNRYLQKALLSPEEEQLPAGTGSGTEPPGDGRLRGPGGGDRGPLRLGPADPRRRGHPSQQAPATDPIASTASSPIACGDRWSWPW